MPVTGTTPLLDQVRDCRDLKKLSVEELPQLCEELRADLVATISKIGGHFGASLGVVELTVAAHYVFDTPNDKLVFDTGHQGYIHKMLTGRRDRMHTIRQGGGLSPFLKRAESPFDAFGAGHAGTAVSAALGMREAFHHRDEGHHVCAIVGDSAVVTGMSFEAMNHAGELGRNLTVILNDNGMSIAPAVGAFKQYLRRRLSAKAYNLLKREVKAILSALPIVGDDMMTIGRRVDERLKNLVAPAFLFEGLGFDYIGPIDGHDVAEVIKSLEIARSVSDRPVLIHALTVKGKGYAPAEADREAMHASGPFDPATGQAHANPRPDSGPKAPQYTKVFADAMIQLTEEDPRVCAITAGMPTGTGLNKDYAKRFPENFYDVGISEQHAVTFAAGLATEGMRPVVAIYSTFLQRGFDQILHDVCLQKLPVVFAMDRGGLVGADGPTHHGVFDYSYLRMMPNMTIMAPKDENELRRMMKTGVGLPGPSAIRFPRGESIGVELDGTIEPLPVGKSEVVFGDGPGESHVIVAAGSMVHASVQAARTLADEGIKVTVLNARFIKPLDQDMLVKLAQSAQTLLLVEENVLCGGFGSAVLELLSDQNVHVAQVRRLGIPDEFADHGSQNSLRQQYGLDEVGIAQAVRDLVSVAPIQAGQKIR